MDWYNLGEITRYILGETYWYILACKLTAGLHPGGHGVADPAEQPKIAQLRECIAQAGSVIEQVAPFKVFALEGLSVHF